MAIFDIFEAQIIVDGEAVREYDFEDVEPTRTHKLKKYIEVEEGKVFEVHLNLDAVYQAQQDSNALCFSLYLDGQFSGGKAILTKVDNKIDRTRVILKDYPSSNGTQHYLQRYAFGKLEINSETVHDHTVELKKRFGTIDILIWPAKTTGNPFIPMSASIPVAEDSIPEKALKGRAVTLSTKLLEPETSEPKPFTHVEKGFDPIVIFNFEYRSRESLYQLGVLKRPSSPTSLEECDIDALSPDEMRALLRRQKDRGALCNTKSITNLGRHTPVKREHAFVIDDITEIPPPKKRNVENEVIDLTDD